MPPASKVGSRPAISRPAISGPGKAAGSASKAASSGKTKPKAEAAVAEPAAEPVDISDDLAKETQKLSVSEEAPRPSSSTADDTEAKAPESEPPATPTGAKKGKGKGKVTPKSEDKAKAAYKGESAAKISKPEPAEKAKAAAKPKADGKSAAKGGTKAGKAKAKGDAAAEPVPLQSSASITAQAEAVLVEAAELLKNAENVHSTFERKLGAAVGAKAKSTPLKDLIREWDKNNDNQINKMEFRTVVRNHLSIKADNKQIDDFFASMDADGGGSLDFAELKTALKSLQDASAQAEVEGASWHARAEQLKGKADTIKEVAAATIASEEADARLNALRNQTAVDAMLGAMILKRNLKIGDVIAKWDKSKDGDVSMDEFRASVIEMGVEAPAEEIDTLFRSLDDDGGGSLDLNELKPTLKKLVDAAAAADLEIKELAKSTVSLRKAAKQAQKDLDAARVKEEEEAKAAAEAAAVAEEEAKREKEEAKRAAKEAKAAKEAAAAAEKAAYDAKIEARRKEQKGS